MWYRRLDRVDADMRRELGADVVDKAKALAHRGIPVRTGV